MKVVSYVLLVVLCASLASSIVIDEDTTIMQDDITYVIRGDSGISEAETFYQGIKVDGNRLMTSMEAGLVNITFHEWGSEKKVEVYSSVPQTIRFKWVVNGSKQYFKDDVGLHIDTYKAPKGSVNITLVERTSRENEVDITSDTFQSSVSWFQRNVFFFVLNGDVIQVTNGLVAITALLVVAGIVVIRVVRS